MRRQQQSAETTRRVAPLLSRAAQMTSAALCPIVRETNSWRDTINAEVRCLRKAFSAKKIVGFVSCDGDLMVINRDRRVTFALLRIAFLRFHARITGGQREVAFIKMGFAAAAACYLYLCALGMDKNIFAMG